MNVGLIGIGYWGPNLVRNFSSLDDVNVVAVCDLREERLNAIKKQYPAVKLLTKEGVGKSFPFLKKVRFRCYMRQTLHLSTKFRA